MLVLFFTSKHYHLHPTKQFNLHLDILIQLRAFKGAVPRYLNIYFFTFNVMATRVNKVIMNYN